MDSDIPNTFNGKIVFITGANGFVGKVLLEKLLRSCPGISEVIVLLRPNKNGCEEKFRQLKANAVFGLLNVEYPDALEKVRYVSGDIISEKLGLDEKSYTKVINEVSFVFHCAANVRFEEHPKITFGVNILGVKNVLDVCLSMKKLEAFVHVSTAYSFCNQSIISEEIYKETIGPKMILDCLQWMKEESLMVLSAFLVQSRPSLYHFSKAMAEIYVAENRGSLPVVIVRPSIITASRSEPFPGWVDNHNGPSGFIALSSKGVLRTLLVDKDVSADWVPVDTVANTLIAAAHMIIKERQTGVKILSCSEPSGIPIINCVCPQSNLISWIAIIKICVPLLLKYPSDYFFRLPGKGIVTSSQTIHSICKYFYHYLPSAIVDIVLYPYHREMRMLGTFQRIHGAMDHLQHYTTFPYVFTDLNMQILVDDLRKNDIRTFPIDLSYIIWPDYLENYVHGVRKFYLKDKDTNLEKSRRNVKRLQYFHNGFNAALCAIVLMLMYKKCPQVKSGVDLSLKFIAKTIHYDW